MYEAAHSSQNSILWSDGSQRSISSHSSWLSNAVQNSNSPTIIDSEASCLNHLSKLADAALRTMIGGEGATVATKGITLFSYSEGPKLAEIAPALFSPDYTMVRTKLHISNPSMFLVRVLSNATLGTVTAKCSFPHDRTRALGHIWTNPIIRPQRQDRSVDAVIAR